MAGKRRKGRGSLFLRCRVLGTVALLSALPAHWAAADSDDISWYQALSENTAAAYQEYLDAYPTGRYSSEAFARIVRLTQAPVLPGQRVPDTSVEPAAGPGAAAGNLLADPY